MSDSGREGLQGAPSGIGKAMQTLDLDGHQLPPSPAPSSPSNGRKYALATELVFTEGSDQYGASSVPIYQHLLFHVTVAIAMLGRSERKANQSSFQSATFKSPTANATTEYDYTRSGNPTRTHLERHVAKVMCASRALVTTSGMAAMDLICRLLRPEDEVITGDDLYGGTNRLLKHLSTNAGIVVHHVDTTDVEAVKRVISNKTAMCLLETPTNPLIKIVDIREISRSVKAAAPNALVVVDNTMLSPYLQNPLDLGADIVYESGTKYLSGHHDVMAGVVGVNDKVLGQKLYAMVNSTGCGLSPMDSFLLIRGIKTLAVRMEKQQANAARVASFLETHGFRVRYPGLRSHPQYDLHMSMARGAGAVLSFETGDVALSQRIVESTRLWGISVSFGCVNSLISMPCQMSHASIDEKTRKERGLKEDVIRLCVGIEDADDLIDDLRRALVQAGAVTITSDGFHAVGSGQVVGSGQPNEQPETSGSSGTPQ
ncbi:MAG: cystathionine beta-lyase [Bathelium mastoideum]|nr:MAG: cystathionine beta-lyase [Bathelium mastoideum]